MRQLTTIMVLVGAAGAFFSGFVFWMANSSHQKAEHLRRDGEYCDVEVVRKWASSDGDGASMSYYVDLRPVNRASNSQPIQHEVVHSTYERLYAGRKLNAWVLGSDALLDYGPTNAASVARTMLVICTGFALLMITGFTLKVIHRSRPLSNP